MSDTAVQGIGIKPHLTIRRWSDGSREWRWTQKTETIEVMSMSKGGEASYHPLQYTTNVIDDRAQNPYARLGLGYQMNLDMGQSRVMLTLLAYHQSSIATGNDRGVNGITFGARYFPFARN